MYTLSNAAQADLEGILAWSAEAFGVAQTQIYVESLSACLCLLAENPLLGAGMDDIRPGYRRFPHQSHVIFYREWEPVILIMRLLHKRMDESRGLSVIA